jgi:cobalamin biosynthesis protein CobT
MLEDEAQPEEGPKSGGDEDTGEQEPERGQQACGGGLDDDSESQGDAGAEEVKTPQSAEDKHGAGDSESRDQDIAGEGSSDETANRPRDTGRDPREGKDEGKPDDGAVPTDGGESGEDRSHDALAAVLSADAGACDGDPFAGVADLLRTAAVPSTEIKLPTLEAFTGDRQAGKRLLERVQAESARLSARLQGLVQSSRMDRQRAVRRGRRLNRSRLHRIAVADERVFARKARRRTAFTAAHLLVDLSGSMNAPVTRASGETTLRANLALESALALALALSGIPGVTVAATAFPGLDGRERRIPRLLAHGAQVRAAAGDFAQHPRGGTPMAQALWYAAADLLGREETRRIAIVLTDGVPNNRPETLRLLALCGEAGIETVGVGIQTDIGHLFPVSVEVTDVADLKRALFGIAERLFIEAA